MSTLKLNDERQNLKILIKNAVKKTESTRINSTSMWLMIWDQNNPIKKKVERTMKFKAQKLNVEWWNKKQLNKWPKNQS
jgi:hypothetical protein